MQWDGYAEADGVDKKPITDEYIKLGTTEFVSEYVTTSYSKESNRQDRQALNLAL